jgi:putative transposase
LEALLNEVDPYTTGRPRKVDLRERFNAIYSLNKTGGPWRYLPKDFPSFTRVSDYYQKGLDRNIWEKINTKTRPILRKESGRNENPSAGIIDSQPVKGTPESTLESGLEGGKRIQGRKRPTVVDTLGGLLVVGVHAATIDEGRAARGVFIALFALRDTVKKIGAEGAYSGAELMAWVKVQFDCVLEVVEKKKTGQGFQVVPRRWGVERTLAGLSRYRRLNRDYERNPKSSESRVYVASSRLMLRRLCKNRALIAEAVLE